MIDTIGGMVQTLVVVVVIATILDMLLPQNRFQQYLRLVVGMLVLLIIINAIAGLLGRGEQYLEEAVFLPEEEIEEISGKGEEMWEENQQAIIEEYRHRLEEYIEEGLQAEGWQLHRLHLEIEEDFNSPEFGRIRKVEAGVTPLEEEEERTTNGEIERLKVEPVRIGEEEGKETEESRWEPLPEQQREVASRLGIRAEKVRVSDVSSP